MPGLVGYVHREAVELRQIDAMVKPMRHCPDYRVHAWAQGQYAGATVDLQAGRQAGIAELGRYQLAYVGTWYDPWTDSRQAPAVQLLVRWCAGGAAALSGLNGEYLISVWDQEDRRLTIVNDRLGLKRLHLWHDENALAWSSELKSLAVLPQISRAIDEQALAELLTFGHLQDDRTLLQAVRLLPPASVLVWHQGRVSVASYWQPAFQADPALQNEQRAVDEYAARVQTAVERRLQGHRRAGLLISGGLDSRTLAGMAQRIRPGESLDTWVTGHAHAHDVRFARQIAEAIGSAHHAIEIPHTFLEEYGPAYAWLLDGMVTTHGAHRACVLEEAARATDVLLIGFLGDVLSGGKPLDPLVQRGSSQTLVDDSYAFYAVGFDDRMLARTLRPAIYRRVRGVAKAMFARSVDDARAQEPADRVVLAELMQRQRRWNPMSQVDLLSSRCHVASPFTDREFVEFMLRLPVSQRIGKQAYLQMIRQEFPRLARIPRSGSGLPLVHSRLRAALHWRWVFFQRGPLSRWTGGRVGGHAYGSYVHCAEWFRSANRQFIESTLIDQPVLEEQFDPAAVNRLVADFLDGPNAERLSEGIAALMSFVLFRQRLEALPVYQPAAESLVRV